MRHNALWWGPARDAGCGIRSLNVNYLDAWIRYCLLHMHYSVISKSRPLHCASSARLVCVGTKIIWIRQLHSLKPVAQHPQFGLAPCSNATSRGIAGAESGGSRNGRPGFADP